jgi:hypothetical protein
MSTTTSVDYLYRLYYSRSTEKYKLSSKNEENERTISVTKKGHCACSHHGPINTPTTKSDNNELFQALTCNCVMHLMQCAFGIICKSRGCATNRWDSVQFSLAVRPIHFFILQHLIGSCSILFSNWLAYLRTALTVSAISADAHRSCF